MRFAAIGLAAVVLTIGVAWTSLNASADTSGPNASGYTWTDSNAPEPTTPFAWMDISGTGTLIDVDTDFNDDDDGVWTQALPFDFVFFGTTYNQVQISTNGFVSFTIESSPDCNENYNWSDDFGDDLGFPIPHGDADCEDDGWGRNPLIAGWFDDLDPGECGNVYYGTTGVAPMRMFIVQYDDVCHNDCDDCEPGEGITFEIILYEGSNDIKIQYDDGFFSDTMSELNTGASATSGLSSDASTGLGYSYAQAVLSNGLAVLYSPAAQATPTPSPSPTDSPAPSDTPTPSPTASPTGAPGQMVAWGDANCSGEADPVDSLLTLRSDAGLPTNTGDCPDLGTQVDVLNASLHTWGDVDCNDEVTPVDSLKLLRFDAGLSVSQEAGCPGMGEDVTIVAN